MEKMNKVFLFRKVSRKKILQNMITILICCALFLLVLIISISGLLTSEQIAAIDKLTNNMKWSNDNWIIAKGFTDQWTPKIVQPFIATNGNVLCETIHIADTLLIDKDGVVLLSNNLVSLDETGLVLRSHESISLCTAGSLHLSVKTAKIQIEPGFIQCSVPLKLDCPLEVGHLTTLEKILLIPNCGTLVFDTTLNAMFIYQANEWKQFVNTVIGTQNQIISSGGSNPILSIDPSLFTSIQYWKNLEPLTIPINNQILQYDSTQSRLSWSETLNNNTVVVTNSNGLLSTSLTTAMQVGYLSTTTSDIQNQLNSKINKAGDTMMGSFVSDFIGDSNTPNFSIGTCGMFSNDGQALHFSTGNTNRLTIENDGSILLTNVMDGVLHIQSNVITSSLIMTSDIALLQIENNQLKTASSNNNFNNVVIRDEFGIFSTTMIHLSGTVTNATDAATKQYVDTHFGFLVHDPADVVSTSDAELFGLYMIQGIQLTTNNRVLLVNQLDPIQNGVWLANSGNWSRPSDFTSGELALNAYFLITSDGSSWICVSPQAVIDEDSLVFSQFSMPQTIHAVNDGLGHGVFESLIGATLHFNSLSADTFLTLVNSAGEIKIGTNATSNDVANTLVARDNLNTCSIGTMIGNVTGHASEDLSLFGGVLLGGLTTFSGSILDPGFKIGNNHCGFTESSGILQIVTNNTKVMSIDTFGILTIDNLITGILHSTNGIITSGPIDLSNQVSGTLNIVNGGTNSSETLNNNRMMVTSQGSIKEGDALANGQFFIGATLNAPVPGNLSSQDGSIIILNGPNTIDLSTGLLSGDVTGTQSSTFVAFVGGLSSTNIALGVNLANAATNVNTNSTIVKRDATGKFVANVITASLNGNASTANNFSGSLLGDVTGTQSSTIVSLVGGVTSTNIALGVNLANNATNINTNSTIVKRDSTGNFVATTITANLIGNATTASSATNFSGSLVGDVTGTQSSTIVSLVGGVTSTNIALGVNLANNATNINTNSTIVKRDSIGNFVATTITANLIGNATTASSATNFSGSLLGDVTGTQSSTVVSFVAGLSSTNIALGVNLANNATNLNTNSTIVKRDATGNFDANVITATLNGNASSANNFSGALLGDVTGTQSSTVVSLVGGITSANIVLGVNLANVATNLNTNSTIVKRDSTGNFVATTITANLIGNATTASTATNFSGSLLGDITGTQSSTVVSLVGGVTSANIVLGVNLANAATNLNTNSTIVKRDPSGNFVATTITANLIGNASSATTATNFSGSLLGDVTGTQSSTVVSLVGGLSSTNIALGVNLANAATNINTNSTIVKRDSSGNFVANVITATLNGNASSANTANNFSGSLLGDVTGTQTLTVVSLVGGLSSTNIALGVNLANAATNINTASTIVKRDSTGNFVATTITANLIGNATTASTATNFSGSLLGDVTGTQSSTVVSLVGGVTSTNIALGVNLANNATSLNTNSTIVKRDAIGNFVASVITLTSLTPNLPLLSDGSKNVVSGAVNASTQITGLLSIANGGTNSSTSLNNNRMVVTSGGSIKEGPVLNDGQFFIGATGSSPTPNTISSSSGNLVITPGPNSIDLDVKNSTFVYNSSGIVTNSKIWVGSTTTTSGDFSISISSANFTIIYSVQATGILNTVTHNNQVLSTLKTVTLTTITGSLNTGVSVLLGGTTIGAAGTATVYITVIGV
jgi:hypothetical protein